MHGCDVVFFFIAIKAQCRFKYLVIWIVTWLLKHSRYVAYKQSILSRCQASHLLPSTHTCPVVDRDSNFPGLHFLCKHFLQLSLTSRTWKTLMMPAANYHKNGLWVGWYTKSEVIWIYLGLKSWMLSRTDTKATPVDIGPPKRPCLDYLLR